MRRAAEPPSSSLTNSHGAIYGILGGAPHPQVGHDEGAARAASITPARQANSDAPQRRAHRGIPVRYTVRFFFWGLGTLAAAVILISCAGGAPPRDRAAGSPTVSQTDGPGPALASPEAAPEPAPLNFSHLSVEAATAEERQRAAAECSSGAPPRRWQACTWLGAWHLAQGELMSARRHLEAACEAGEALGCVGLGAVWMRGGPIVTSEGLLRDPARARAAWQRACELKEEAGCRLLSELKADAK